MPNKKIIVGARGSLLSVCQAEGVIKFLKKEFPQYSFSLKKITTLGDRIKDWGRTDKGIFVKEIQEALLRGQIDLAVHSMKDLPCEIPRQLKLVAVTKREDPCDVLVSKKKITLFKLNKGAVIGTSSLRRKAFLLHWRPDLRIKNLRGNLDTRIKKLKEMEFDAIVVACAGIIRLGRRNLFLQRIPTRLILPAAGQGALGIEVRAKDKLIEDIARTINDQKSFICISSERAFLKEVGGGCRLPLGALAEIKNGRIHLEAVIISLDGRRIIRLSQNSLLKEAEELGERLAKLILERGGKEILENAQKDW